MIYNLQLDHMYKYSQYNGYFKYKCVWCDLSDMILQCKKI